MLLANKRILMFEDNIDNIGIQQMLLKDEGADVKLFMGGTFSNVIDMLPINLIIMDLMIAGNISGFDYFEKIQAIPQLSDIPIVAVSAMDVSLALTKAREMGFAGFIAKPVDMDRFPHQIAKIIDGQKLWNPRR